MKITEQIQEDMKSAMKEKNQVKLAAVRAIKSEILKEQTSGKGEEITDAVVLKIIQKMVKQRNESIEIYKQQNRQDLVDEENSQLEYIKCYLPKQLSKDEIEAVVVRIIAETNATSIKDMGKVMKAANTELAGKADSKLISEIVKSVLNK